MWADDRYAKVTQADVNEAKKRVKNSFKFIVKNAWIQKYLWILY
jgi:hypothetical protein